MGVREYLYGASLGHRLGEERLAAYKYGYRVVVRGTTGGMAQQEERRAAEAEPVAWDCDTLNRMGDERASARSGTEHACAYGVWMDTDGCRSGSNRRDLVCAEGSEYLIRDRPGGHQQLAVSYAFRESSSTFPSFPPPFLPLLLPFLNLSSFLTTENTPKIITNPPFQLLYTSGLLFMGATEEQMALLSTAHVSHVSYILILYSVAFLLFLFVCMLLHLYAIYAWPLDAKPTFINGNLVNGNGHVGNVGTGHVVDGRRVRDAEEFELEGLMSDDDDGLETPKLGRREANGRAA